MLPNLRYLIISAVAAKQTYYIAFKSIGKTIFHITTSEHAAYVLPVTGNIT